LCPELHFCEIMIFNSAVFMMTLTYKVNFVSSEYKLYKTVLSQPRNFTDFKSADVLNYPIHRFYFIHSVNFVNKEPVTVFFCAHQ
jgi:hypothetical protein